MFTQRQTYLEKGLLSAVMVLLLLTTAGQSVILPDILQTTATPAVSVTTQLNNSSMEGPRVLRSHRSCASEHENYCENGGKCMYPQDSEEPFCICTSSYGGTRCLFFSDHTRTLPELEELIGFGIGAVMLIFFLVFIIACCTYKRCKKSATLKKSAPSEPFV